jgi:hypothetical protein
MQGFRKTKVLGIVAQHIPVNTTDFAIFTLPRHLVPTEIVELFKQKLLFCTLSAA